MDGREIHGRAKRREIVGESASRGIKDRAMGALRAMAPACMVVASGEEGEAIKSWSEARGFEIAAPRLDRTTRGRDLIRNKRALCNNQPVSRPANQRRARS